MRSLDLARESWQELQTYKDLQDLRTAVRLENNASAATSGLRSICWKAFLLFDDLDQAAWQRTLTSSRSAYNSLRSHFLRFIENPDDVNAGFDPLSQDAESSPWSQLRKDDELRAEIKQDVDRCMPEIAYFRLADTKRLLIDVLFIYSRLNPDVGYKQGMHELLAHILWVVEADAIELGGTSKALGEDGVIQFVFDANHIEHDAFALFGQVMQSSKGFYVSEGSNSIAARCQHISTVLLPQVDPVLAKHLSDLDVLPQVYLIRWVRLLFGREFEMDDVLALWDVLFADDPTLELVDYICIAILLRSRWHLLDADHNGALGILLKHTTREQEHPAQSFALDALYLRSHRDMEGASYLVLKYTGRPLTRPGRPGTPPALQRNITTFSGLSLSQSHASGLSPQRSPRQGRNIEAIFQNTAMNIRARSEKFGIGKAVRSAVDEVHKRAQEIRDAQTPSSPPPWRRGGNAQLVDRIAELESRNKRLSVLLSGAVSELWDYQRLVTEQKPAAEKSATDTTSDNEAVDKLSAAIAKVQFVQVYLDEPGLALAEEDINESDDAKDAGQAEKHDPLNSVDEFLDTAQLSRTDGEPSEKTLFTAEVPQLADPSSFEDFPETSTVETRSPLLLHKTAEVPSSSVKHVGAMYSTHRDAHSTSIDTTPKRPQLEQSAYSFMLGQGSQAEARKSPFDTARDVSRDGNRAKIALFGDDRSPAKSPKPTQSGDQSPLRNGENEFDMGSLRRARRAK